MAEERKKVWEKIARWYQEQQEHTRHDAKHYGERTAFGRLSLPEIVDEQRSFQYRCRPVSKQRDAMFERDPYPRATFARSATPLWQDMMRTNVLATIAEMIELLETCPWKPWKKDAPAMTEDQVQEARLEIVDALCFLLNCWMLLGGDGEELAHLYYAKMKENHRRQEEGY